MSASLAENAPAKVNLTLRVVGRRADGYHEIESLVAFAGIGDRLSFLPSSVLSLTVNGRNAALAGANADNLVLRAACALAERVPALRLGTLNLEKNLPVAAGLGGGSADAAAALRLLARVNGLTLDDPRLQAAARTTGADVPVCVDPKTRLMRGIGEILSEPLSLPTLHAVLVNPGLAVVTKDVFARWTAADELPLPVDIGALNKMTGYARFLDFLLTQPNDLEAAAIGLAPPIAEVLVGLRALPGCGLARMSGSGGTCFGVFASASEAAAAAKILRGKYADWWISETALG